MQSPSVADVRTVITTSASDAAVQAHIDDALMIAEQCSTCIGEDTDKQASIVKWIAAHLLAQSSGEVVAESIGDASKSYGRNTKVVGHGLASTRYGERALMLDPTGCLARLGRGRPVFRVL